MQQIEKPKNAVIYVRVSSKQQVDGFSLEVQEKICKEYCERGGYKALKVFREEGESAKTTNRTRLQEMVKFCEIYKKQVSMIVFYSVSRMSREMADYHALKKIFGKCGISVVSATEQFDSSPSGKLQENMLAAFAQFDNDVRSVRTIEGMKTRLMKGLWSGKASWGMKNDKDIVGTKIITYLPEAIPVIRMLFESDATGKYSHEELAKMANKSGQKSRHGKKITKQLVFKILKNPIYCGRIVVPKFNISVKGSHEAIISEELFDRVNSPKKGKGSRDIRSKDNPNYPLRGIKCSACGGSLTGGPSTGKMGKIYQYYACINKQCEKKSIKKADLEEDFTKFLLELTPNESFFEALKEAIRLAHRVELNSTKAAERKLTAKIIELKNEKEELLNMRIKGKISDEDFTPANEKYRFKILELEKEFASLSTPELEIDNVIDSSVEFLKHLPESWKNLDVKDLRVLRTLLFPKNLIYSYPTIKTPELCCIYNIKSEFLDEKNRFVTLQRIEL